MKKRKNETNKNMLSSAYKRVIQLAQFCPRSNEDAFSRRSS
ncbi:MAG: hypothetical protein QE277_01495 [Flectobacillus sp.]|nr:hypothetical protein [Flectobacillus sp.]